MADDPLASSHKRRRVDDDDAIVGGAPPLSPFSEAVSDDIPPNLPCALMYERSYMHRDQVLHVHASPACGYIITADASGFVKFWKKLAAGVEFVKNFKAFVGPVNAAALSADGCRYAAAGTDGHGTGVVKGVLRFWDVSTFDLVDYKKVSFTPGCLAWVFPRGSPRQVLAVSDRHSSDVHLFDTGSGGEAPFATLKLHAAPVCVMAYSPANNLVISCDGRGMVEVWSPTPDTGFLPPAGVLTFSLKMDTDMFALAKARTQPTAVAAAPSGRHYAVQSTDGHTRVFSTPTGRVVWDFNDSPASLAEEGSAGSLPVPLAQGDLDARLAGERDLVDAATAGWKAVTLAPPPPPSHQGGGAAPPPSAAASTVRGAAPFQPPSGGVVWDEAGDVLLYSCALGVKVVHVPTGTLLGVLGAVESTERFTALCLYQGWAKVTSQQLLARDAGALSAPMGGAGPALAQSDPTLIACAFRRHRLFLLTRREPDDAGPSATLRDVLNEPPSQAELAALQAVSTGTRRSKVAEEAVIHTTCGDVHVKLFPADAPKAVENFVTLSRRSYYAGLLWHRVIKGFMVQGGDPRGDGTGGESCWGKPFEDEVVPHVTFAKPGMLAMANAGPCSNGSQFFLTTAPCAWLNGKHTILGAVTRGMEVVRLLEGVKTGKDDRPLDDVRILGVTVKG